MSCFVVYGPFITSVLGIYTSLEAARNSLPKFIEMHHVDSWEIFIYVCPLDESVPEFEDFNSWTHNKIEDVFVKNI
jgi:hypothetical protein